MYLSLAVLDPGDEIVCGWPSFPSYVLDAIKLGAEPKRVPLPDHRYDVDRILDEVGRGRSSSTSATPTTRPGR